MTLQSIDSGLELEKIEDQETNEEGYIAIPSVEDIPAHFAQMGKTDAANMLSAVIERAKKFRARGIKITHRVYYSGDEIQTFLQGTFGYTTANLLQTLDHLDTILPQYLGEDEVFYPTLEATLFWGESQFGRDYFLTKDRLSLHGGMTATGVHERLMRSIIKRTARHFLAEDGAASIRLEGIVEAVRLAQAELGVTNELKITPKVIEAMAELETDVFDGTTTIIRICQDEKSDRLVISGIPQVVNCYHATLEDTVLYSTACWGEFVCDPSAFVKRALEEASLLTASQNPRCTLLHQLYLNLARIQSTFGHIQFHFVFENTNIAAADLFSHFQQIPYDKKQDIGAYIAACHAVIGVEQKNDRTSRNATNKSIRLLSSERETIDPITQKAMLRKHVTETSIDEGGMALFYNETDKAEHVARRTKYLIEQQTQQIKSILPAASRRAIGYQAKGNKERISEFVQLVHEFNKRYGIEVSVKYRGATETPVELLEKRTIPRHALLLRTFGTISEAIATLTNAHEALIFYDDQEGNPFEGQLIELYWFDEQSPDELKYDVSRKKNNTFDTDKPLVHHQCGHVLDMLSENVWETLWFDRDYDRVLCKKRAIDSSIAMHNHMTLLEFLRKDESIVFELRKEWLDKKIEYRFQHQNQTIIIADFINKDGAYRGSPTQFSLTSGAEERAELWMMFTSNPAQLGDLDLECQTRLVAMAQALVQQNILSKNWFVSKNSLFADILKEES